MRRSTGAVALAVALAVSTVPGASFADGSDEPALVQAVSETRPLFDDEAGGNANGDDPAVWIDPDDSGESLVVVTKKEGGLDVYDLDGALVQEIAAPALPGAGPDVEPSRFNNVDIVQGARIGHRVLDVAIVSDRGADIIRTYAIDGDAAEPLREITSAAAPWAFATSSQEVADQVTAYGLAARKLPGTGRVVVGVSRRHTTEVAIYTLTWRRGGVSYTRLWDETLPDTFTLGDGSSWSPCGDPGEGPQVEGMVFDPDADVLYAAQEDVGIWEIWPARPWKRPTLIEKVREFGMPYSYDEAEEECIVDDANDPGFGGEHIGADVEGLTIYRDGKRGGYLLASSQGTDTFVVLERGGSHDYVGRFQVATADGDVVEASDGSTVVSEPLGDAFPGGVFIAHDGHDEPEAFDDSGEQREVTNFKFTAWPDIADALGLGTSAG